MSIFEGYAKHYDLIYKDKDYKGEAEFVYEWANKPKTILSLGCGTGGHERYWCEKARVVGIDNSKEMLKRAHKHKNIEYIHRDIKDYETGRKFDCVVAMFNVMGYYPLWHTLSKLPLKSGGYFIFDCWDYNKIIKDKPRITTQWIDNKYLRVIIPMEEYHSWLGFNILIIRSYSKVISEFHKIFTYIKEETEGISKDYGYKVIDIKDTSGWTKWYKLIKI